MALANFRACTCISFLLISLISSAQTRTDIYPSDRDSIILKVEHHYRDYSSQQRKDFEAEIFRRFYTCDSLMIEQLIATCGRDFYLDKENTGKLVRQLTEKIKTSSNKTPFEVTQSIPRRSQIYTDIEAYQNPNFITADPWDKFLEIDGIWNKTRWKLRDLSEEQSFISNYTVVQKNAVNTVPSIDSMLNVLKLSKTFYNRRVQTTLMLMHNLFTDRAWDELFKASHVFMEIIESEGHPENEEKDNTKGKVEPPIYVDGYFNNEVLTSNPLSSALSEYNNTLSYVVPQEVYSKKQRANFILSAARLLISSEQLSFENVNHIGKMFGFTMGILKFDEELKEELNTVQHLNMLFIHKLSQYEVYDRNFYNSLTTELRMLHKETDSDKFFDNLIKADYWNLWWTSNSIYQEEFNDFSKLQIALGLLSAEYYLDGIDLERRDYIKMRYQFLQARMTFLEMNREFEASLKDAEEIITLMEENPNLFTIFDVERIVDRAILISAMDNKFFKGMEMISYASPLTFKLISHNRFFPCVRQNFVSGVGSRNTDIISAHFQNTINMRLQNRGHYTFYPFEFVETMRFILSRSAKDRKGLNTSAKTIFGQWYFDTYLSRTGNTQSDFYNAVSGEVHRASQIEFKKTHERLLSQQTSLDRDQAKYNKLFDQWTNDNLRLENINKLERSNFLALQTKTHLKQIEYDILQDSASNLDLSVKNLNRLVAQKDSAIVERDIALERQKQAEKIKDAAIFDLETERSNLQIVLISMAILLTLAIAFLFLFLYQKNKARKEKEIATHQRKLTETLTLGFSQMGHFGTSIIRAFSKRHYEHEDDQTPLKEKAIELNDIADFLYGFSIKKVDGSSTQSIEEEIKLAENIITLLYSDDLNTTEFNQFYHVEEKLKRTHVPLYTVSNIIINTFRHSLRNHPIHFRIEESEKNKNYSTIEIRDFAQKKQKLKSNPRGLGTNFIKRMFEIHNGNIPTNFSLQEWQEGSESGVVAKFNLKNVA